MTAPTVTPRSTPNGVKMGDGYQTLVTFARHPDAAFWEKSITPPGLMGDELNDTSTMHNVHWRTKAPRHLVTMQEFTLRCLYDPKLYVDMLDILNKNDTVTIWFPNGDAVAFYGVMRDFKPGELVEGQPPEADITVAPTNQDPITCEEAGPTYVAGPGTACH